MENGGKRKGAGRPKGSKNHLQFRDYWSEKEIKEYVEFTKSVFMADMKVHSWVGDQLFGKAPQAIDVTSGGEKLPTPILNNVSNNNG